MSVGSISKIIVENNEKMLITDIGDVSIDMEASEKFYCGIDCGSTQTRVVLVPESGISNPDLKEWFKIYTVIPSKSKSVPFERKLKPRSNLLYDNMDSIFCIDSVNELRLVRGSKINDIELAEKELTASSKKVTSETLRYNIVDAIGYNLVQYYAKENRGIPGNISISLSIALPPDDLLDKDIFKLRTQLSKFRWSLSGRMDHFVQVTVTDLAAYSEPEAQVTAYYLFSDEEAPEEVLLLESGGRNSAPVILLNGNPVGTGLKSIDQSGSKLLDKIGLAYMNYSGKRMPDIRHLEHAVKTGRIKSGNGFEDITDIVKKCKDEVAEDLFQRLQADVLSKQTIVRLETLNEILLSGRVYLSGEYDYSVANRLKKLIHAVSPDTEVKVLRRNLIPQGLVLLYLFDKVLDL